MPDLRPSGLLVEGKTKNRSMDIGKKGESYDQIINKLVDFWLKKKR